MFKLALVALTLFSTVTFGQEAQKAHESNETSAPSTKPTKFSLGISDVKIYVEDSTGSVLKSQTLKQPKKIEDNFSAEKGQIFKVHFFINKVDDAGAIVSPTKLDMATVLMNHTETGTVTYVPFGTSKVGSYRLNLGKKNFPKFIQANPGKYDLTLLVAATEELGAIHYSLGKVHFETPLSQESSSNVQRYGPRPSISHTFRKPEPTPHFIVSYTFTGILAVPWLFLIFSWNKLGANIYEFPLKHFGHSIAALGFLASLVANIGLSYYYWVSLPLFPTLAFFGAISGLTVLTGRFALDHVQNRRDMTLQ